MAKLKGLSKDSYELVIHQLNDSCKTFRDMATFLSGKYPIKLTDKMGEIYYKTLYLRYEVETYQSKYNRG